MAPILGNAVARFPFSARKVFRALAAVSQYDLAVCYVQIEAYSLSQPTLEQVFLNVIGDQLSTDTASI